MSLRIFVDTHTHLVEGATVCEHHVQTFDKVLVFVATED
jgi:hypothetical protein